MNWFAMALGVDLGCLVALLWLILRAPLVEEEGAPPHPATEEPQRALLEPPTKIPAPGYAVRALEAERRAPEVEVQVHDLARLAEERGPTLAPEWFSRAMRKMEKQGRERLQEDALDGKDHRRPLDRRGAL